LINVLYIERPVSSRVHGVSESVLRVREGDDKIRSHVKEAVYRMYDIYGPGLMDVTLSANVVLTSNVQSTYSLFYGQDFSTLGIRERQISDVITLTQARDWKKVPTDLGAEHFEGIFNRIHEQSDVHVEEVVSLIFVMRRWLSNFERDKTVGKRLTKLY
jgi:hypothetical protein